MLCGKACENFCLKRLYRIFLILEDTVAINDPLFKDSQQFTLKTLTRKQCVRYFYILKIDNILAPSTLPPPPLLYLKNR